MWMVRQDRMFGSSPHGSHCSVRPQYPPISSARGAPIGFAEYPTRYAIDEVKWSAGEPDAIGSVTATLCVVESCAFTLPILFARPISGWVPLWRRTPNL